jgi:hypothetical protein
MKKKIYAFKSSFKYLQNADHIAVHTSVSERARADAVHINSELITKAEEDYRAAFNHETMVINPERASVETPVIHDEDSSRDADISYIEGVIATAARYAKFHDKQMAAIMLQPIFAPYKGVQRKGQTIETGLVIKMLEALGLPEHQPAIATLGLQPAIDNLIQSNAAFQNHWDLRASEKEAKRLHGTVRDSRANTDAKLAVLAEELADAYNSGLLPEDEQARIGNLIDFVNAQIAAYIDVLSHRSLQNTPKKPNPGEDADGGGLLPVPPEFG